MTGLRFDVTGIGNAIVDTLATAEDDLLAREKLNKGGMALVDEARADHLYSQMSQTTVISGGSAANTIVGAASFGAKTAFIGKVKDDAAGREFAHDIRGMGVHFTTPAAIDGPATARCLVFVTPDGERTMNTYLGACQNLTAADVDPELIKSSAITYLEGYLWDPPAAKEAFIKAADIAHDAGQKVALTLSDAFCVDRYRAEFLNLIRTKKVDIVFANQHELRSLYETSDFDTALGALRDENILGVVTRSEHGSVVVTREATREVGAFPIDRLVDTTGAGDLFAAGFLAGLAKDKDLADCARLGALAAAEVIQHVGARPQKNLAQRARENGLAL
ncbi:MAG: adenosine kinase [Alphaproteobacteria bacterium]|nr:adenosine kinase [Alphaproteobacteria bacterium]